MAKPADHQIEASEPAIGKITVPDKASLGWSPAEHLFVQIGGEEAVGQVLALDAGAEEDEATIEFSATGIPPGSMLADIDWTDSDSLDLDMLLSEPDTDHESEGFSILADSDTGPGETPAATQDPQNATDVADGDLSGLPIDLTFPQLTIVIDDDGSADTVAL